MTSMNSYIKKIEALDRIIEAFVFQGQIDSSNSELSTLLATRIETFEAAEKLSKEPNQTNETRATLLKMVKDFSDLQSRLGNRNLFTKPITSGNSTAPVHPPSTNERIKKTNSDDPDNSTNKTQGFLPPPPVPWMQASSNNNADSHGNTNVEETRIKINNTLGRPKSSGKIGNNRIQLANDNSAFEGTLRTSNNRSRSSHRRFNRLDQRSELLESKCDLIVTNIADNATDQEFHAEMSRYGKVSTFRIARDNNGVSQGSAYVLFETPAEATNAFNNGNNTIFKGKRLHMVYYSVPSRSSGFDDKGRTDAPPLQLARPLPLPPPPMVQTSSGNNSTDNTVKIVADNTPGRSSSNGKVGSTKSEHLKPSAKKGESKYRSRSSRHSDGAPHDTEHTWNRRDQRSKPIESNRDVVVKNIVVDNVLDRKVHTEDNANNLNMNMNTNGTSMPEHSARSRDKRQIISACYEALTKITQALVNYFANNTIIASHTQAITIYIFVSFGLVYLLLLYFLSLLF